MFVFFTVIVMDVRGDDQDPAWLLPERGRHARIQIRVADVKAKSQFLKVRLFHELSQRDRGKPSSLGVL